MPVVVAVVAEQRISANLPLHLCDGIVLTQQSVVVVVAGRKNKAKHKHQHLLLSSVASRGVEVALERVTKIPSVGGPQFEIVPFE